MMTKDRIFTSPVFKKKKYSQKSFCNSFANLRKCISKMEQKIADKSLLTQFYSYMDAGEKYYLKKRSLPRSCL